jgi:hypothetical protein
MRRRHGPEPWGKSRETCRETAVRAVWIADSTSGQKRLNLAHQSSVILLQRRKISSVEDFAHA